MLSEDLLKRFAEARSENPVFARMDVYDADESERDPGEMPYVSVTAAVCGLRRAPELPGELFIRMAVLVADVDRIPDRLLEPVFGTWMTVPAGYVDNVILLNDGNLKRRYSDFQTRHEESPYIVKGALFSETAVYGAHDMAHSVPVYRKISGSERSFSLKGQYLIDGDRVNSLGDAVAWMIENHPDYLQGLEVIQDCPSGDVLVLRSPGPQYGKGYYENFEARHRYAEKLAAEQFGELIVGPREAAGIWQEMRGRDAREMARRHAGYGRTHDEKEKEIS